MKTFIDESGGFGWHCPGKSTFCSISVPDQALPDLYLDFFKWKHRVLGLKKRKEVKGRELTTKQLRSFVELVVMPTETLRLTYVAVDTQLTSADIIDKMRSQWAEVVTVGANRATADTSKVLGQFYQEMAGWIRHRSSEQFLWLMALYACLFESIQNTFSSFADQSFDQEFAAWDIVIDRSFIKHDRHMHFWLEWLRHQLRQYSVMHGGFKAPAIWMKRDHPVMRNLISGTNLVDGSILFGKRTYFEDSQSYEGLQLADICAHIFFRYLKNGGVAYEPLTMLRERINDGTGGPIRLIHMSEDHIWKDSAEAHVHALTRDW
jgi:hypothetical protein